MGGVCAWNLTSSRCGGLRAGCVEREVAADYPSLRRQLEPVPDLLHTDDSSRVPGVVAGVMHPERRTPYSTLKANAWRGSRTRSKSSCESPLSKQPTRYVCLQDRLTLAFSMLY